MIAVQRAGRGRPLRFLAAIATGWISLRAALLWPEVAIPTAGPIVDPIRSLIAAAQATTAPTASPRPRPHEHGTRSGKRAIPEPPLPHPDDGIVRRASSTPPSAVPTPPGRSLQAGVSPSPGAPPFVAAPPTPRDPDGITRRATPRWSASAWGVMRAGRTARGGVTGGQLGGSQAGLRIVRSLDRRARVAISGRLTTPFGAGLREASVGLEWQPTRLPMRLVAEHRFVLGSGTGGPGIGLVGGFGPVAVLPKIRAEGYGQAGVLHRTRTEPYADGALRLTHDVARVGGARVALGAGAWGGAQRGAARLDVGPTLAVSVPVADKTLRMTLDWRERIAGRALPGSGPVLTLGTDF